jgi:hypothetical protein
MCSAFPNPDFTPQRQQQIITRFLTLEAEARLWITSCLQAATVRLLHLPLSPSLGLPSSLPLNFVIEQLQKCNPDDEHSIFAALIEDGSILCALINALYNLLQPPTNRFPSGAFKPLVITDTSKIAYKRVDNIYAFLNACKKDFGLQDSQLFEVVDLISSTLSHRNIPAVLACLYSLCVTVKSNRLARWMKEHVDTVPNWPSLTKHTFTSKQIEQAKNRLKRNFHLSGGSGASLALLLQRVEREGKALESCAHFSIKQLQDSSELRNENVAVSAAALQRRRSVQRSRGYRLNMH